jgi:hypothetical protein
MKLFILMIVMNAFLNGEQTLVSIFTEDEYVNVERVFANNNPTCPLTSLIRELRRTICFASVVAKVVTLASSRISHFVHLAYAAKGG